MGHDRRQRQRGQRQRGQLQRGQRQRGQRQRGQRQCPPAKSPFYLVLAGVGLILSSITSSAESFSPAQQQKQTQCSRRVFTNIHATSSPSSSSPYSSAQQQQSFVLGAPICEYHQVTIIPTTKTTTTSSSSSQGGGQGQQQDVIVPRQDVIVQDLTGTIMELLQSSGMQQGTATVISRHTTTAITINEQEQRLVQDMKQFFLQDLAPPDERSEASRSNAAAAAAVSGGRRYFHNDIDQRPDGEEEAQRCRENGWDIDNPEILQQWRDQEPINAHSHLLSMLLGSSESIPVVNGKMVIGKWQSILLVDLDGPRNDRTVGIQFMGYK